MNDLKPSHIELHDAQLESITITRGQVSLNFAHLAVFHEVKPLIFEIWSYKSRFILMDCREIKINGIFETNTWISEATICDKNANPINFCQCLNPGCDITYIELITTSGVVANFSASRILVTDLVKIKMLEIWKGPLY